MSKYYVVKEDVSDGLSIKKYNTIAIYIKLSNAKKLLDTLNSIDENVCTYVIHEEEVNNGVVAETKSLYLDKVVLEKALSTFGKIYNQFVENHFEEIYNKTINELKKFEYEGW